MLKELPTEKMQVDKIANDGWGRVETVLQEYWNYWKSVEKVRGLKSPRVVGSIRKCSVIFGISEIVNSHVVDFQLQVVGRGVQFFHGQVVHQCASVCINLCVYQFVCLSICDMCPKSKLEQGINHN